jgi:RNA polymerase sigma-70 factor, ECF subfamily
MCVAVSDAELVAALTEGRPEAFRAAWKRFSPLVGGVLRHALGSDELEDVQQDVFSCLFRRVATLRDPSALRPFVLAITLNTVKHERRRRRRRARMELRPDLAQLDLVARDEPATSLAFVRFAALVRKLAERERATFVFRFVEGMTVSQVAVALNISEPTARRSFSRAWARMQKWAAQDPFLNDYLHGKRAALPEDDTSRDEDEAAELSVHELESLAPASRSPSTPEVLLSFQSCHESPGRAEPVPSILGVARERRARESRAAIP